MKKRSLETLAEVQQVELAQAKQVLALEVAEAQRAAARLNAARHAVECERGARGDTEAVAREQASEHGLLAVELQWLDAHCAESRRREQRLVEAAETSRRAVEAAKRAELEAAEGVKRRGAEQRTTQRLAEQVQRRELAREEASAEEEALEAWVARHG